MKFIQEITEWDTPNHIYYVSDDKSRLVGYIQKNSINLLKFDFPIRFSVKNRKFVEIKSLLPESDEVYFGKKQTEKPSSSVTEVQGSNGKIYYVSKYADNTYSCTCPGFTFRRTCKHIKNEC